MDSETIEKIKDLTESLGELVISLEPANKFEWDAHDSLTAAHKALRKIDPDSLVDHERRATSTR
jgi:hypothetical protein